MKSNGKVVPISQLPYSAWRTGHSTRTALHERSSQPPAEHLLQAIWQHQRLRREALRTSTGQTVRILHPGFWNHGSGPDFADALVQIGNEPPRSGDIEIDLEPGGWRAHAHDRNPAYQKVILHVIWSGEAKGSLPTLALHNALDAPLTELEKWLEHPGREMLPERWTGRCSAPLRDLTGDAITDVLRQAARFRLEAKAQQFHARARHVGWEQALWEGVFRALGYRHNTWPMVRVAESLPALRALSTTTTDPLLVWQARLLGIAGLLPTEAGTGETGRWTRAAWDIWWRDRETLGDWLLPIKAWQRHGLRPANQPVRRLALAAHWLAKGDFLERLETWFLSAGDPAKNPDALLAALQVPADPFWSYRWTFTGTKLKQPQPLLGDTRLTDLATNIFLPWLWMRAVTGKNAALQTRAEQCYFNWPAGQDNAVLKLARQRLLGGAKLPRFTTAAEQQGLLQIVRDFCEHANALCQHCRFPDLIRDLKR